MSFFTPEQIEIFSQKVIRVDFLIKMEFLSETKYLWNGHYDLKIGLNTYKPLHGIASLDGLGALMNQQSEAVSLKVSGLPTDNDFLSLALEETPEANQQLCTLYLQFFDEDWQPVGSPTGFFWGFMQPPRVERSTQSDEEGATQAITIDVENAFFNRSKPPFGRLSDRDQQIRSPGDLFLQFAMALLYRVYTYPDF